jgi:IclR family acetate operon transcriptional repressor
VYLNAGEFLLAQTKKVLRDSVPPPQEVPQSERYFSKAIGNALNILDIFKRSSEALSLSDVTKTTKLPKSSVFRILRTLEVARYVERTPGDHYILSPLVATMILNSVAHNLVQAASPLVHELNREFRETVSVACLFENHIEVVLTRPSTQRIQMGNILGSIIPPHASSLGKCIVAYQSEVRRERLLRTYGISPLTPKTITDELELSKELELVRERGYATDLEETTLGGYCFGAPIREHSQVVGAISLSIPSMRCEHQEKLISAVVSTAAAISSKLG